MMKVVTKINELKAHYITHIGLKRSNGDVF